jgi:hypothetical protein
MTRYATSRVQPTSRPEWSDRTARSRLFVPLVRVLNWLSYLNGSAHVSTKLSGFAGTETWQQVDFASRYGL